MQIRSHDIPATQNPITELDRLGDEIAELSAHLEAATARLLDLIRDFDASGPFGPRPFPGRSSHSNAEALELDQTNFPVRAVAAEVTRRIVPEI